MHSKPKIPDSGRTGWKAKACTSFVLYLKVFKNHLYYLWHVRVLSIKPCLHTQLPEHNKSYLKVSRGWGHLIPGMDLWWGIWTAFRPREGGIFQKFSKNSNARGGCPGGMLKLRFDWYISNGVISRISVLLPTPSVWFSLDCITLRFWSRLCRSWKPALRL